MSFLTNFHIPDSLIDLSLKKKFCFSAEIIPPRNGTDFEEVFQQIHQLKEAGFDFISVTHGAGGSLRGGTLPICFHAQNIFRTTAIAHLTERGLSKEDLENTLIDHNYFGINNILALRGDPPDGINAQFIPVENGFRYAYQLVELINNMNNGIYIKRNNFQDKNKNKIKTNFCIGVASYPEDLPKCRISYLKKKVDKGANFSITQMVLNQNIFFSFLKDVQDKIGKSFPVFPGIRLFNSYSTLLRIKEKFGISVEDSLVAKIQKNQNDHQNIEKININWCIEFIKKLIQRGVKGIHFFIMGDTSYALQVKSKFQL